MRVQLGGEGGQVVVCDLTVTAAVPIAAQPRRAADRDGGLEPGEPPTIPPRLLLRPGNAAADGERGKFKLYGDRWVVPRGALAPLSYEVHGAASSSTHAFVERVAQTMYPGGEGGEGDFGGRRAAFISMLRQRTSVALQTARRPTPGPSPAGAASPGTRPLSWVRAWLPAEAATVLQCT